MINAVGEPHHNTSLKSVLFVVIFTDESSMLPCEFCQQLFSADNLILHEVIICDLHDMVHRGQSRHFSELSY